MPDFTIQAPNGRKLTVSGEREPSESEWQEILRGEGFLAPTADQDPFLRRVAENENLTGEQFTELVNVFNDSYKKYATEDKTGKLSRAAANARESFFQNTVAGKMIRDAESEASNQRFAGYENEKLRDNPKWQQEQERLKNKRFDALKKETRRYGEYLGMPDSKGVMETAMAATGQLAGAGATPESLVGAGAKGASFLAKVGRGAAEGMGINLATELPIQQAGIEANRQEGYSASQAALAAGMGAVIGGGMRGATAAGSKAIDAWRGPPSVEIDGQRVPIEKPVGVTDVSHRADDFKKAKAELQAQQDAEFKDPIELIDGEQADFRNRYAKAANKAADDISKEDKWVNWDMENRPDGLAKEMEGALSRNQLDPKAEPNWRAMGIVPVSGRPGKSVKVTRSSARHADLEAKYKAGKITPDEIAEAQAIVDRAADAAGLREMWNFGASLEIDPNRGVFYTTSQESAARSWGEGRGNSGRVRRVFIQSKNPAVEGRDMLSSSYMSPELSRKLKERGFDSVLGGRDWKRGDELAVFSQDQIKSADPFTGTPIDRRFGSGRGSSLGLLPGGGDLPKALREIPERIWAWIRPGGKLPRAIYNEKVFAEGAITGEIREMNKILENTRKEAFRVYGKRSGMMDKRIDPEDLRDMNDYLAGRHPQRSITDPKLLTRLDEMRSHRMRLSKAASDVTSGRLREAIDNNMDVYLHRAYRIFDDPAWTGRMRDALHIRNGTKERALIDDAKTYLYDMRWAEFDKEANAAGLARGTDEFKDFIDHRLVGEVGKLLDIAEGKDLFDVISTRGRDISTITKRQNIDEAIRKLWGEYEDPFINYGKTVSKVAQMVEMTRFYDSLWNVEVAGRQLKNKAEGQWNAQIPDSARYGSIAGKYTTPEMREALLELNELGKVDSKLFKAIIKVNAYVNVGKTVLSPTTQVRNVASGFIMNLANGRNPFGPEFFKAMRRVGADVVGKEGNIRVGQIKKYAGLALFDESPDVGNLRGALDDARFKPKEYSLTRNKNALRKAGEVPFKFYGGADTGMRIAAFEVEIGRYSKALGKNPETDMELRREMALLVRDTYPTYANVGKLVKVMRRVPAMGNFMSFHSELIRTVWNTAELGIKEVRSSNPAIRKIGAKRLAGLMTVTVASEVFRRQVSNWIGSDPEEREAAKAFMPEWDRDGANIVKTDGKGGFSYANMSYTNPYALYMDTALIAMSDMPDGEKVWRMTQKAMGPFLDARISTRVMAEIWQNPGNKVRNPSSTIPQQVEDSIAHAWSQVSPGFVAQTERQFKAWTGKSGNYGREYNKGVEALAGAGLRVSSVDAHKSMIFMSADLARNSREASNIFTKALRKNPSLDAAKTLEAFQGANQARHRAFTELRENYDKAIRLGGDPNRLGASMREGGLSTKEIAAVRTGRFIPYWPSDEFLRENKIKPEVRMQMIDVYRKMQGVPLSTKPPQSP